MPKSLNRKEITKTDEREATRRTMHSCGIFFLLLAATVLVWDVINLMDGRGIASFSALADIWSLVNRETLVMFETTVSNALGYTAWYVAISPVLSVPAALLFGLPGLALLIKYSRDISLYAPTAREIEYMRMGGNIRRR
jgi:hypothetical protein